MAFELNYILAAFYKLIIQIASDLRNYLHDINDYIIIIYFYEEEYFLIVLIF